MGRQFQELDTSVTAAAACSGATLAATPVARAAVFLEEAPAFTAVARTVSVRNARAAVMFELDVHETVYAAGNWVVRLHIATPNANITWTETWLCRRTSGGSAVHTVGSLTGQSITLAGLATEKSMTVSGAASTGAETDKLYIVLVLSTGGSIQTFQLYSDSIIDTPLEWPIRQNTQVRKTKSVSPDPAWVVGSLRLGRAALPENLVYALRLRKSVAKPQVSMWTRTVGKFRDGGPEEVATPSAPHVARVRRVRAPRPSNDLLVGRIVFQPVFRGDVAPPEPNRQLLFVRKIVPARIDPKLLRGKITFAPARRGDVAPDPSAPRGVRNVRPTLPVEHIHFGRVRRWAPPTELLLYRRQIALRADLDILAKTTYRVIAQNVETGAETTLGTGTSIVGVSLADGKYILRIEADGRLWRAARFRKQYLVTIAGGEIVQALPVIQNLVARVNAENIEISWIVENIENGVAAEDFGVWADPLPSINTNSPIQTSVTFSGSAGYFVTIPFDASFVYVAVAARLGSQIGPISEVAILGEGETGFSGPAGVSARNPDGNWTR